MLVLAATDLASGDAGDADAGGPGAVVLATGPDVLAQQPFGGNVAYRPAAVTDLGLMARAGSNPCNDNSNWICYGSSRYNRGYGGPLSYNRSCAPYGLPGMGASL
jgi:hypothetical protein